MLVPEAIRSLTLIAPAGMRTGSGPGALPSRAEPLRRYYFDQSFVQRVLAQDPHDIQKLVTVAAPRYLEKCGVPQSFDELQTHFGVRYPCPWVVRASDLQFQVLHKPLT